MSKNRMYFRMITASLFRRRSRMVVALLAIAIGAAILSGLITIYRDVPRQMGAQFRNYGANMILTANKDSFTEEDLSAAADVVKKNELVGATPFRYETVRIHEQPVMAAGTDMKSIRKTSPYWLVDGTYPKAEKEMLVGEKVADDLGLKVGDQVSVVYTPEGGDDREVEFKVAGTLSTGGSEEDYLYLNMADLEALTGQKDHIDLAEVSISTNAAKLNQYVDEINQKVPDLTAKLVKRVTASETTVLSKLQALVLLVTVIVLALTLICVATTMTAVVSERRNEIGLRKAIGASDESIIAEFMGEGIVLGAAGGFIGVFVGFGFAQFVSVNVFSSYITLNVLLIPLTILVSIAVSGIACLFPIKSATSIDPALVLKGE